MADSATEFKRVIEARRKTTEVRENNPISYTQMQENRAQQKSRNAGLPQAIPEGAVFSMMGPNDVEACGVYHVTRPSHQGGRDQGSDATSLDARGGTVDYRFSCVTCGKSASDCEGHHGILSLTSGSVTHYIYSSVFKKYVPMCLKCICIECGNIMFSNDMYERNGFRRLKGEAKLKAMSDQIKKDMPCPFCGKGFAPEYIISKKFEDENIIIKKQQGIETHLTPREVHAIFSKITGPALEKLGFSRGSKPTSFILTKMPVIPVSARPPSFATSGSAQPDGTTKKYNDIVSSLNRDPPKQRSKEQNIFDQIAEFIENKEKNKSKKNKGRPVTTNRGVFWIKGFLDGKKGVIRDKMMGKRKNFTARSVLCPGIHLRFGELGVPVIVKEFLTSKETVTGNTYQTYLEMFGNSFEECKITHVIYNHGKKQGVPCKVNSKESWQAHRSRFGPGDEVYRMLKDGDIVLFNRQPTLGADSMMGYTIKFIPGYSIRLHLCDTTKHNADFDGDEGNLHLPQTIGMKMELATFAHASNRIISEHNNSPTIGVVFNGISTAYLLSQDDVELSPELWAEGYIESEKCQGEMNSESFKDFERRLSAANISRYSGKALISSLFPRDFYYQKGDVVVERGILLRGVLTKDHVGRSSNSLIQSIFGQYGKNRTCDFITQIYFLLDWYISVRGLTVSYTDCALSREMYYEMVRTRKAVIRRIQDKIYNMSDKFSKGNAFAKQFLEKQITEDIKNIYTETSIFLTNKVGKFNPMSVMINSGAKGKEENMVQILGTLGQQILSGTRPALNLSHGKRCLPHFKMNSRSIYARGFCEHSFGEGLSPTEQFFHAQGSRIGLMDTGIRVSETGSIQRRMMKVMEDTFISPNGAVVNTSGSEFSAVNLDGFNPINMSNVKTKENGTITSFINLHEIVSKIKEKYI